MKKKRIYHSLKREEKENAEKDGSYQQLQMGSRMNLIGKCKCFFVIAKCQRFMEAFFPSNSFIFTLFTLKIK